jgi:WD40 repeat protein
VKTNDLPGDGQHMGIPKRYPSSVTVMRQTAILWFLFVMLVGACAKHFDFAGTETGVITRPLGSVGTPENPPELVVQLTHARDIRAMALSGDGHLLITASWEDRTVRLWNAQDGVQLRQLKGHEKDVIAVSLSQSGDFAMTGSEDGTARLWNTSSGEEIRRFSGHSGAVTAVAFSGKRHLFLSGGKDRTVRLWHRGGKEPIWVSNPFEDEVSSIAFSPDGRYAVVGSHLAAHVLDTKNGKLVRSIGKDVHESGVRSIAFHPKEGFILTGCELHGLIRRWDVETGHEIQPPFVGHDKGISAIVFSSKGDKVLTASVDKTARLWDVKSAQVARDFEHTGSVSSAAISPDGNLVYTASQQIARAWEVNSNADKPRREFKGESSLVSAVAFSPDGHSIVVGSWDNTARLWDATSGVQVRNLKGHTDHVRAVAFSPDGRLVVTGSRDGTARIWDTATGKDKFSPVRHKYAVRPVSFSTDGRFVLTGGDDGVVRLWNLKTDELLEIGTLHHPKMVTSAVFSPVDNRWVLTASGNAVYLWDTTRSEGSSWHTEHKGIVNSVAFHPDGRLALSSSWDNTAVLWDLETGKRVKTLEHPDGVIIGVFSPSGKLILTGCDDGVVRLWDAKSGEKPRCFVGHTSSVVAVTFSPDGRYILTASEDQTARLWETASGRELAILVSFNDGTWAVVDPEGRYDADSGGDVEGLHWVVGLEPIGLSQLKERYYEPHLLAKVLGFNEEPLRDVQAFKSVAFYPAIELVEPTTKDQALKIKLTNRGGGIGRVIVWINGKEVTADARGRNADPDAPQLDLTVPLTNHPFLNPGENNLIEVRAFNSEGYLSSRGVRVLYQDPGPVPHKVPLLWAIVVGISDYDGDRMDLRYASKDAQVMAKALQLGGKRLLGAENVKLTLLDTNGTRSLPTKSNIKLAFEEVGDARPWDILVVYFAGHGVAVGDTYYYLAQEARSAYLSDPAIRGQVAVSSEEMVRWLNKCPAQKQVMVLDTCAAGTAARKLVEKRDLSSDQIRAIERLKDRTGFHVLMGSAADAVSYEASQYEQGLLTYALLKGMKGAALRQQEFIDVSTLFNNAAEDVQRLAQNIGGIQTPRIAAPKGTSFDIGQLTAEDREKIPLAQSKPFLLPPLFLNHTEGFDTLSLTALVRKKLRDESYASGRGGAQQLPVVYVDAEQFAGAISPSGTYSIAGDKVQATVVLVRDQKRLKDLKVEGNAKDPAALAAKIVEGIMEAVKDVK